MLPRRRAAWASWNFHLTDPPATRTALTYWMNNLQRLDSEATLCVTLNLTDRIDPAKVIRTIQYSHPVFTPDGVAAQARHGEISGVNRTHYCGAYWRWGFHEDGVVSALNALARRRHVREGAGGMSASAIYDGWVRHRRTRPVEHSFTYRHAMLLLDLDELPGVLDAPPALLGTRAARRCASAARTTWATPRARSPSACATWCEERTGERPPGPVRLLTTLRTFGHNFNPVCFYYCFAPAASAWRRWWRR